MSDVTARVLYADTSSLLKLVVREAESTTVEHELTTWAGVASSSIAAIELRRAVLRARADQRESVADDPAVDGVIAAIAEIPLTARVRDLAGSLEPPELRSLDAIHLASALALGRDLAAIMTYDSRLRDACQVHGIEVIAPTPDPRATPPGASSAGGR